MYQQEIFKLNYVHPYDGKLLKYGRSISTDTETYIHSIFNEENIH